jgi:multidrug resistance efflux pump
LLVAALIALATTTLRVTIQGRGVLHPTRMSAVRAPAGGRIVDMVVQPGESVQEGQPVARLAHDEADLVIQQLRSRVEAAVISLRRDSASIPLEQQEAQQGADRAAARQIAARATAKDDLLSLGLTGNTDSVLAAIAIGHHIAVDRIRSNLLTAEVDVRDARTRISRAALRWLELAGSAAELRRLRSELLAATARRELLEVRSPATGTVLTSTSEALKGVSVAEGEALLEIGDVSSWTATVGVSEQDIHRIRVGDDVLVEIPALSSVGTAPYRGSVSEVAAVPGSPQVGRSPPPSHGITADQYRVVIAINPQAEAAGAFRYGFAVSVRIVTRSARAISLVGDYFRRKTSVRRD